jgi:hypothetical protein
VRNIFGGGVPFDNFELEKLQELQEYIDSQGISEISREFEDSERLKFLSGNDYKMNETVQSILEHLKWRIQYLPCKLTVNAIKLLVTTWSII